MLKQNKALPVYILGAGKGGRLNLEMSKPLVKVFEEQTFLSFSVEVFRACGLYDISVVTGFNSHLYDKEIENLGVSVVESTSWERGILYSYHAIWNDMTKNEHSHAIIIDGDVLLSVNTIRSLLKTNDRGFGDLALVSVNPEKAFNIGLCDYQLGLDSLSGEIIDHGFPWGCCLYVSQKRLCQLIDTPTVDSDLFVKRLYGISDAQIAVEENLYLEIDTPEDLELVKNYLTAKPGVFWVNQEVDFKSNKHPTRLHSNEIAESRISLEKKALLDNLSLTGDERVCDIGAGIGTIEKILSPHVKSIQAFDINPRFVDYINGLGLHNVYACVYDATKDTLGGQFDLIILFGFLHYIVNDNTLLSLFSNCVNSLSNQHGNIVIRGPVATELTHTVSGACSSKYKSLYSARYRTLKDLEFLFDKVGLEAFKHISLLPENIDSKFYTKQVVSFLRKK